MAKGDLVMVAGLAGFLLGGIGVYVAASHDARLASVENVHRTDEDSLAGLGARLEGLDEAVKGLSTRVGGLSSDPKALWDQVHRLEAKVADLERRAAGVGGPRLERPADTPSAPPPSPAPPQDGSPPDTILGPK